MLILVTGASGQLGKSIKRLVDESKVGGYVFTSRDRLDLSYIDAIQGFFEAYKFDLIINCAAYTAVDKAETDKKNSNLINHLAVKKIAELANKNNIKLIHISTDFVFDGLANHALIESDIAKPVNVYGKSKLAGEQAILSIMKFNATIIRTSWLYSEFGNNFVVTMLRLMQEKPNLSIVSDQVGTPTYASDLAKAILCIVESDSLNLKKKKSQIYHYSNEGECSWYEFASEIKSISDSRCILNPISTDDYPTAAERPKKVLMNKQRISQDFDLKIQFWKDSLKVCLNNILTESLPKKSS